MMDSSLFFRLIVILAGICLMLLTFFMYSRRRLTDHIAMGWGLFSFIMILAGLIRAWSGWSRALALASYPMVFAMGGMLILIIFMHSVHLSQLVMKNQELAIQVSLLNQENEELILRILKIEHRMKAQTADEVSHE